MCTLSVCSGVFGRFPLVVGANRDEFYKRPSGPPFLISDSPRVFAPSDLKAGGTWLGVNEFAIFAGLTNLSGVAEIDSSKPSRGTVLLDALKAKSAREAAAVAEEIVAKAPHNPFQALFCDLSTVYYLRYDGTCRLEKLGHGVWSLSNWDAFEALKNHKSSVVSKHIKAIPTDSDGIGMTAGIATMLADHTGNDWREHICVHTDIYGTMSSSIILLSQERYDSIYRFYEGHPCETASLDLSAKMTGALGWSGR